MSNIFFGKTQFDCVNSLIQKLKDNYKVDKNAHHIFIVPDRISVLTEIKIFENLNIDSTSNIEVCTLSRLSSKIIEEPVISKTSSCMILQKLLKDNKQNLKCFNKKIDTDLATTIFETISQFKSCRIPLENIVINTQNKILQDKLQDISLLYSEYQKHLKKLGLYDSLDRLNFVQDKIKEYEEIKNSYVYVGNFDSYTLQALQVISGLIKYSKEFNIGLTNTDNLLNCHIYNQEVNNNILKLFNINNIEPNINFCEEYAQGQFKYLQDNLFSFNSYPLKIKAPNIELFEGKNFEEEVVFVASKIKDLIANYKYKFTDIVVAVPNLLARSNTLQKIFSSYNFNFYIDIPFDFSTSPLIIFINNIFQVVLENFSSSTILSLLKSPLLNIDYQKVEDFEDYILKYNIKDFYALKNTDISTCSFYNNFKELKDFLLKYFGEFAIKAKEVKTYNQFANILEEVLLSLEISQKLTLLTNNFAKSGNVKQAKLFEQYYNSFITVLDNLKQVLGEEECDLKLFFSTLNSGFKSVKISTSPLSTNSLFVGDCSSSFFDSSKIYFVVGADEKNFPLTLNDCGLISDKEIKELSCSYKLEPSIESINGKERFKSYQILLLPKQKLFLSYNFEGGAQKSKILKDVSQLFVIEDDNSNFYNLPFKNYDEIDFEIINNNLNTAKNNLISQFREIYDGQQKKANSTLFEAVKTKDSINLTLFNYQNILTLKDNAFFSTNTVSVSQVESFMTCPFLHFVRYGLKLKDKDMGELNSLNVGTILHAVAQKFIEQYSLPLEEQKLEKIVKNIFDSVISTEIFEAIKHNKSNQILINNLFQESLRFCSVLNYQAKYSLFKPIQTEARFDDKKLIKSFTIKTGNKILKLVGQVDRIDQFNGYFRIIDYKTGQCDTSLKELFFGKKVQLEAYAKVVENSLKLKPAGAYYMPVKSGFADSLTTLTGKYQLKGATLNSDSVINASDNRFNNGATKSDIVEVKYTKNDGQEKKQSSYSKIITEKTLKDFMCYAVELIKKACEDILQLNITPSPLKLGSSCACESCKYFALCRFDENFNNSFRSPNTKITEDFFEKGEE